MTKTGLEFQDFLMIGKPEMRRHELSDEQYKKIESILPGRKEHVGVTARDNRIFINGVLWIFKTGAPWRDLPERYGQKMSAVAVIPPRSNRKEQREYDKHYYKDRNLVERFFCN